jgi:hypothetical protein
MAHSRAGQGLLPISFSFRAARIVDATRIAYFCSSMSGLLKPCKNISGRLPFESVAQHRHKFLDLPTLAVAPGVPRFPEARGANQEKKREPDGVSPDPRGVAAVPWRH